MTPRVKIIMEQVARFRVAGIHDNVIAAKLGMTQAGLSRILALQEYRDLEAAVLGGVVTKMDASLAGRAEAIRDYTRQAIPAAVRALVEATVQRRDLRASIAAADKLIRLDPDKTLTEGARLEDSAPAISEAALDRVTEVADKLATKVVQ